MIIPTVGRVVWVWPEEDQQSHTVLKPEQPFDAHIVCVISETEINVAGFDHVGAPFSASNVGLWDGEGRRPSLTCWQWMPYQKGQAAKYEQLERANVGGSGELGPHVSLPTK